MSKFSEDMFNSWRLPPSDSEETKLANAERMVKEAIVKSDELNKLSIEVFGQGSYANDTNVRLNSDVDINVRLSSTIFVDVPVGKTKEDYGYTSSDYQFSHYKQVVYQALVDCFGKDSVKWNDKCITVTGNSYRVPADVVPTFKYITHFENGTKTEGTKFISDEGKVLMNYAHQHIENGKTKNAATIRKYKRLTRIFKRVRYKMIDDGITVNKNITSFLIECLIWNVPNNIFNSTSSWSQLTKEAIIYLYNQTQDENLSKDWVEVSERLHLFRPERKWTISDVNTYLVTVWNYLEFK